MRLVSLLFAAAILLGIAIAPKEAEAKTHFSFLYHGPGFSIYIGPRGYRYYRPYPHYRPYYYRRYYGPRVYRQYSGRCSYWSRRCAANWGYGNRNYRGCMRYYGCR
jgi:hypothetical protein